MTPDPWAPYTPDDTSPWTPRRVVHLHRRAEADAIPGRKLHALFVAASSSALAGHRVLRDIYQRR